VSNRLSLQRFCSEVESLLDPLDESQLRSAWRRYATALPAGARGAFLDDLRAACRSDAPAVPSSESLLADIDSFITDAKSGMYYDTWDWDPDLRMERAFGDESWIPRMDALFARAGAAFRAGHHDLSGAAYRRLFAALELEGDEGCVYACEYSPEGSLETDLAEASAQCLRSLYETASGPAEAAASLAQQWLHHLPAGHRPESLSAVREALVVDLADLDQFCPHWTRELVNRSGSHDPLRSGLLREAAQLSGGVEALADAARKEGNGQARAYLDLVAALREQDNTAAALDSCREGLTGAADSRQGHEANDYWWAPVADVAADLAGELGNDESAAGFRLQAFTLMVSEARLVGLYNAAEQFRSGTGPATAGQAADRLSAGDIGFHHAHLSDFRAQALLLAGRVDEALALLPVRENAIGGYTSDVSMSVLPYVLAASCGAPTHHDWPHTTLRTLLYRAAQDSHTVRYDTDTKGDTALPELFEQTLRERAVTDSQREAWRSACRTAVDRWVRVTLAEKQRHRYADAANLAAAMTEAEILVDGNGGYLDGILDTYRRFTAFRREADRVRRSSVLL
jgi:hypothetical protein